MTTCGPANGAGGMLRVLDYETQVLSLYLLYWYKSASTDTATSNGRQAAAGGLIDKNQ